MIRTVAPHDSRAIVDIYNYYITHTVITFETDHISLEEMQHRIHQVSHAFPYFVYEVDHQIVGYCYAHPWKTKKAYQHTWETTIYLHPQWQGKGIGTQLMKHLIAACKQHGCHGLIACITQGNEGSNTLHTQLGFKQVSHFKEVGYKMDRWLDVIDFELLLNR